MSRLSGSKRGAGILDLAILAIIAVILFFIAAIFFPAFTLAILFFLAGIAAFYFGRASPYGIAIGLVLIIIAAIFGFVSVGQTASLSLVHGV
jgi:hypothetical protein